MDAITTSFGLLLLRPQCAHFTQVGTLSIATPDLPLRAGLLQVSRPSGMGVRPLSEAAASGTSVSDWFGPKQNWDDDNYEVVDTSVLCGMQLTSTAPVEGSTGVLVAHDHSVAFIPVRLLGGGGTEGDGGRVTTQAYRRMATTVRLMGMVSLFDCGVA